MEIRARFVSGLPKTIVVSSTEIHKALEEPVQAILDAVKVTLERTPELAADIMDRGIMMAGGGSLLTDLTLLMRETGMPVHITERPLTAVVEGTGEALKHFDLLQRIMLGPRRY